MQGADCSGPRAVAGKLAKQQRKALVLQQVNTCEKKFTILATMQHHLSSHLWCPDFVATQTGQNGVASADNAAGSINASFALQNKLCTPPGFIFFKMTGINISAISHCKMDHM